MAEKFPAAIAGDRQAVELGALTLSMERNLLVIRGDVWHSGGIVPVEASDRQLGSAADTAWSIVRAASTLAESLHKTGGPIAFGLDDRSVLRPGKPEDPDAVLAWSPSHGWRSLLGANDARSELLNLYLPICSATSLRPMTIGHLGQSLDGFIATHSGDSQFVTGDDNIVHLHRMRALTDAVVVGAGTVATDDPQLTVRHVPGSNPLRVVFDPGRRLTHSYRVFTDDSGPTLYVCSQTLVEPGETRLGTASVVGVDCDDASGGVAATLRLLHSRGCWRVFVEGGGVTVSAFLQANLLDRLQIAIAPVIIGDGRPAIRLAPHARLRDCRRPSYRVFRMGGDVLFDCDLQADAAPSDEGAPDVPPVNQVI
ncbi:MAG TPA: RibD family protein [Vicinamibacterales bacterium]|nr:RibD family protein [Vicinamibacterales bacterium]